MDTEASDNDICDSFFSAGNQSYGPTAEVLTSSRDSTNNFENSYTDYLINNYHFNTFLRELVMVAAFVGLIIIVGLSFITVSEIGIAIHAIMRQWRLGVFGWTALVSSLSPRSNDTSRLTSSTPVHRNFRRLGIP